MNNAIKILRPTGWAALFLIAISGFVMMTGFIVPQNLKMPVQGATKNSYNPKSFWCYPWGKSVTHKGVDIFAKEGTPVFSSTVGVVMFAGKMGRGGNAVLVLGPKWRVHYYAHLQTISTRKFALVNSSVMIGKVGTSGNAKGKPPHLHYTIATLIPYPWRVDNAKQGALKAHYLNPIDYL